MLFNHTLNRIDYDSYLFEYDNAFQERRRIVLPGLGSIKVGGTASAGNMLVMTGKVISVDAPFSRGVVVLTVENNTIDCIKREDLRIGDIVYVYEHMSIELSTFGIFDFVASKKIPVFINLHSINIDYINICRIYIDPHTDYISDQRSMING